MLKLRETRLLCETDLEAPLAFELAAGRAAAFTHSAPEEEPTGRVNEDSLALIPAGPGRAVLAVADGAGGLPEGEAASRLALEALSESVLARGPRQSLREAILNGIEAANARIRARGSGAGSTLAVAEINRGTIRPYHVGDAVILVVGQRGALKLHTIAHSPVGYGLESGLLDEEEAAQSDERHFVCNLLGTKDMRIEVGAKLKLAPRDTLLLTSDGLIDNLYLEEIVAGIRKGELAQALEGLSNASRTHMQSGEDPPPHPDDLSLIAYRLKPRGRMRRTPSGKEIRPKAPSYTGPETLDLFPLDRFPLPE